MCLSRATGSRPVHPATTAWSIASVSGVVAPWASMMVNVRSNTDHTLHCRRELEDTAIRSASCGEHQSDRCFALAIAGYRDRATVNHVGQGAIAQREQVRLREGLVVREIGDARRNDRRGRHHKGLEGSETNRDTRDQRFSGLQEIDVLGSADALPAQDSRGDPGIIDIAVADDEIAVPGVAFCRGKAALA